MQTSERVIQVLENVSEKLWDFPSNDLEISGWTENSNSATQRKSAGGQYNDLANTLNRKSKPRHPTKPGRKRIPLVYTYRTTSIQEPYKKSSKKTSCLEFKKFLPKVQNPVHTSLDLKKNLQITTIPLSKPISQWRNGSLPLEKRASKLENYYDRTYLINKSSPPVVSGYSVTFYHK